MRLEVFEPAMCCTSGVCGAEVDAGLVRFAADLKWLVGQGVVVERYNLSQQPGEFLSTAIVRRMLQAEGPGCLPLGLLNGRVVFRGEYARREELQRVLSVEKGIG